MASHVKSVGRVQVVEIEGDVTFGGNQLARPLDLQGRPMEDLGEVLARLFERGDRYVVLDLSNVTFVDSAGLGQLVAAKKRAVERGGDIRLLRPPKRLRDLLVLTMLTNVFEVHDDEQAAIASFGAETT